MSISGKSFPGPNIRLAVLLLAAGEGSRLGAIPKALLKKDGSTLLQRFYSSVRSLCPVEMIVVTGFHASPIEEAIASLQQAHLPENLLITVVRNPHPELGQSSSVRLGLQALKSSYDVLLVSLSDQPNVGATEVDALLDQFKQCEAHQKIVVPMVDGQRGNPVLFSKQVIDQILSIPEMVCRPYMDQHPELVQFFVTQNQAYVLDVDTDHDIQSLGLDRA